MQFAHLTCYQYPCEDKESDRILQNLSTTKNKDNKSIRNLAKWEWKETA